MPITGDLRALLAQRLRRVPTDAREALLLASLLSDQAEDTLARAFGPDWDQAIDRGREAGIIEAVDRSVRFVHPLFSSVVVGEATERERRAAHGRLATACSDGEERARHAAVATTEPDATIAEALEEAANRATRRGAPDAAAELAELALALTPGGHPRDVYRRCTMAGEARFAAGDSVRALDHFSAAESAAIPGPERSRARWRIAWVRFHHDDIAAGAALLEDACEEAGNDDGLRAAIEHDTAYCCLTLGDIRATHQHATSAADLAERAGSVQLHADSLAQVAVAACLRGDGLQIELMERALELEDWDEPRWALARPSVAVADIYSWVDRIDESRELLEESERQLLERGDDGSLPYLWYRQAELDCWSGEWERGHERALEADRLAIQTSQQGMRTLTSFAVGLLAAHLGRVDEARAAVDEGVRLATATGHGIGLAFNLSVLGFLELSLGHADRADAIFGPIVERARAIGFDEPGSAWWIGDAIEAAVVTGAADRAEELTDWVDTRARAIDRANGSAVAGRGRALLFAGTGHVDDALSACDEALGEHERAPLPFPTCPDVVRQRSDRGRARKWGIACESLTEALAGFEALGATLWAGKARDELARIGGRPAVTGSLTESERQIADLVAAGRSNREVAEALFLSPKTVSANLARIYRKLGVSSRTEMAAHLHGH